MWIADGSILFASYPISGWDTSPALAEQSIIDEQHWALTFYTKGIVKHSAIVTLDMSLGHYYPTGSSNGSVQWRMKAPQAFDIVKNISVQFDSPVAGSPFRGTYSDGIMYARKVPLEGGDLNSNGVVDAADADILFKNWYVEGKLYETPLAGNQPAVPEPSGASMLAVSFFMATVLRRKHDAS